MLSDEIVYLALNKQGFELVFVLQTHNFHFLARIVKREHANAIVWDK